MPTLTRRRYPERPDCWHIFYGDVRVGTITRGVYRPYYGHSYGYYRPYRVYHRHHYRRYW
jgi:hypothetical protein